MEQKKREPMDVEQEKKQQLIQQKEERKNQLQTHDRIMTQKTAEIERVQSDLYSKEQQQFQLQSQREDCSSYIDRIRNRTDINEQRLNENQQTTNEIVQARHKQQIKRQVIIRDIRIGLDQNFSFSSIVKSKFMQVKNAFIDSANNFNNDLNESMIKNKSMTNKRVSIVNSMNVSNNIER